MPILQAGPEVDVWSLGGILSETATWITQGKDGLERYRKMRLSCQRYCDPGDSDCFHDGIDVLPFVTKHHDEIQNTVQEGDYITGEVLGLVGHMLTGAQSRLDARKLRLLAKDALDRSKGMLANLEQASTTPSVSRAKGMASVATRLSAQTDSLPHHNMSLHSSNLHDPAPGNFRRETGSYTPHTPPTQHIKQFPTQGNQSQLVAPQLTLSGIRQLKQHRKRLLGPIADLKGRHYVSPTSSDL